MLTFKSASVSAIFLMMKNVRCLCRRHSGGPRFRLHWRESNNLLRHVACCGPYGELWTTLFPDNTPDKITLTGLNHTDFILTKTKNKTS